jgi:hypothetical protein
LFENEKSIRNILKPIFKAHGVKIFLQWLQDKEKKENLTKDDALSFQDFVKENFKATEENPPEENNENDE